VLVDEVEAFLRGRAGRSSAGGGAAVAANWLAHAEPTAIEERVRYESGLRRPGGTWDWAISTLARELVELAGARHDVMRQLQHDCLVPVELALLEGGGGDVQPRTLVTLGLSRLRAHPGTGAVP